MKKIPTWIIIIAVMAILIASKFVFFGKKDEKAQMAGKSNGPMPVAVNYFVVKPVDISKDVFATGKIGALNQVEILAEVSGKITAIYFKEGETVQKGNLLVKLNDADLQAQFLKTKTQLKLSEQKTARLKKLLAISGVSQEEYEMQENEVASLKADEAYLSAQLAKTNIIAPFSGVIGLKNISEGSFVNSSTPIVSLVQVKPLFVEFSVPEKYAGLIKKGVNINFSGDKENSSKSYSASVYAIEPRVEETTKTIKARAMYNGETEFYPGSFVKVFVNLGEEKNALMVPTQCVIPTLKGQKVYVAKDGVARETQVCIGVRTDEKLQVLEGLSSGDTVITTGLMSLKKDSRIKVLKTFQ
jgi:membrane fusion protein (multidrug efflux system)